MTNAKNDETIASAAIKIEKDRPIQWLARDDLIWPFRLGCKSAELVKWLPACDVHIDRFDYFRLQMDHWAVPVVARGYEPWKPDDTNMENCPEGWDGRQVLLRNGDIDHAAGTIDPRWGAGWSHDHGIVGYTHFTPAQIVADQALSGTRSGKMTLDDLKAARRAAENDPGQAGAAVRASLDEEIRRRENAPEPTLRDDAILIETDETVRIRITGVIVEVFAGEFVIKKIGSQTCIKRLEAKDGEA